MRHEVRVLADAGAVALAAAEVIAARARAAVRARGTFAVAVSGGRTPWAMLAALADMPPEAVPWAELVVFQVDERVAAEGDPTRNLTHLRAALSGGGMPQFGIGSLQPGNRSPQPGIGSPQPGNRSPQPGNGSPQPGNGSPQPGIRSPQIRHAAPTIMPMPVEEPDLDAAAARYAASLPAALDLVHLGLGVDGHTASLVPGDPVLAVSDRQVALTTHPYQGQLRMTLTYPALAQARELLWVVTGSDKAEALAALLAGSRDIPAGRVTAGRSLILADAAAAGG